MIDRSLYAVAAIALAGVLMFDETFFSNLARAFGPIALPSLNPWVAGVGGIFAVLIAVSLYRERR
jgi:hypothetical protein